jgi:hypothetical protein
MAGNHFGKREAILLLMLLILIMIKSAHPGVEA